MVKDTAETICVLVPGVPPEERGVGVPEVAGGAGFSLKADVTVFGSSLYIYQLSK